MLKNVLIGTNVAYTSAVSPNLLASGEIGVYGINTATGVETLTTTANVAAQVAAKNDFRIAQGVPAGKNIRQFIIKNGQKKSYLNTAYVAPIPNVYNVGFDGTAYDMVSGAAGTYGFKVQNLTLGQPPFPSLSSTPFFQLSTQATSIAISNAIVKDLNAQSLLSNNDVMPEQRFAFAEVLSSANTVQLVTSAPANITATVTNGSDIITLSASSAGGATPIAVGDYLRIGHATTETLPVYKVKALISATSIQLEMPYVNPSVTVGTSIAGVAMGWVVTATVDAASSGVRVTEFGNVFNGSQVLEPYPNKIMNVVVNVNLSGTPVQNNSLVAKSYLNASGAITSGIYTEGAGTYAQVFKKELVAAGYSGFINRIFLPDNFPLYSVSGTNYVTLGLQYNAPAKDYTAQGFTFGEELDAILAITSGASQITDLNTILAAI